MYRSCIFALIGALALIAIPRQSPAADETAPRSISEIMRAAHVKGGRPAKQTLDLKVIGGRATDEEKKQLLKLYEALARQKPPAGSLDGWEKDTAALVEAAREALEGKPEAAARLTAATNCASCHDKYRFGRALAADKSVFLKAQPPELVEVAGTHPRHSYVIVYALKVTPVTKVQIQVVEREVLVDGRKEIVKETVKVPVIEQKRETVESTLWVKATGGLAGSPHYRVLDARGKEVDGDELWKRLQPGQLVLRQPDSKPPDAAYLKLFGADVLIFVTRPPDLPPAKKPATSDAT